MSKLGKRLIAAARGVRKIGLDFGPGSHGCHEALHMTSVLIDLVDRELVEHEAIMGNPKWSALAAKAQKALGELYSAIGREHIGR